MWVLDFKLRSLSEQSLLITEPSLQLLACDFKGISSSDAGPDEISLAWLL